ncbi:hypothetical protein FGG79_12905 [Bacillus sp. BHET2]|nr:hypothetical protein FGG79_12905 [Bacillus sp. BHET2]
MRHFLILCVISTRYCVTFSVYASFSHVYASFPLTIENKGEMHESRSNQGMTAIVAEGSNLDPKRYLNIQ